MDNAIETKPKLPYAHHYMLYVSRVDINEDGRDKVTSVEYINNYTEVEVKSYCDVCGETFSFIVPHDGSYAIPPRLGSIHGSQLKTQYDKYIYPIVAPPAIFIVKMMTRFIRLLIRLFEGDRYDS